jgi:hypothetical protein
MRRSGSLLHDATMSDVPARRVVPATVFALTLCVWCGWVSGFHHSSTPALAMWSASLAGVGVIDLLFWRGRRGGRLGLHLPPARTRWPRPGQEDSGRAFVGLVPWLALTLVVLVWELLGIDTGPHQPHLTISALAQAFRPFNAALLLVWILVGLGYGAARARAPVGWASGETAHGASPGALSSAAVVGGHPATVVALLLPPSRAVGVAFWVGLIVACVLVEIAARRSRGRLADAEEFVRLISGPLVANALFVVAWTYAGWHLFAH